MTDLNTTAGTVGSPPAHYAGKGGIDNFDVWDAYDMDRYSANAFKYLARCSRKGSLRNDLLKARHYVEETRNRILRKGKHLAVFAPSIRPMEVVDVFDLTGEVAGAVVSLLLYRMKSVNPERYLELAIEQIDRAIEELGDELVNE